MNRTKRDIVPKEMIREAIDRVIIRMEAKSLKHGARTYESTHEIYGIIAEEFNLELTKAMHENDLRDFEDELTDIAVSAIWGLASLKLLKSKGIYDE